MPTAKITLPNGSIVNVEGTPDEVANLLSLFSAPDVKSLRDAVANSGKPLRQASKGQAKGPTGHIRKLKEEGFFKSKRALPDVQKKLEEMGHIYAQESLSPVLVRLVRARVLGRIKEAGTWKYVDR